MDVIYKIICISLVFNLILTQHHGKYSEQIYDCDDSWLNSYISFDSENPSTNEMVLKIESELEKFVKEFNTKKHNIKTEMTKSHEKVKEIHKILNQIQKSIDDKAIELAIPDLSSKVVKTKKANQDLIKSLEILQKSLNGVKKDLQSANDFKQPFGNASKYLENYASKSAAILKTIEEYKINCEQILATERKLLEAEINLGEFARDKNNEMDTLKAQLDDAKKLFQI